MTASVTHGRAARAMPRAPRAASYTTTRDTTLRRLAAPLVEDLSRALAAQGNNAFAEANYAEARERYAEAIRLHPLPQDRLNRYRHSYLVASTACMSFVKTPGEARAIMAEMRAQDPPPSPPTW